MPDGRQRAFPTAEGFGAAATGGRGGVAIPVTTLADSGAGSLRECMMAVGARTCVFRVAGTITLLSRIQPTSGNLTVAGQTAPGGGIAIRNDPSNLSGPPIFIKVPNVIMRHIRIRPGATSGTIQGTTDSITVDLGGENSIFDHMSLSWATDELFNTTGAASKITVQWSLLYEGLSHSTHGGEHSKAMFIEGEDMTLHHNFIANNTERNPNAGNGTRIDVVNNVTYNMSKMAQQYFSMIHQGVGRERTANIVGNWVSYGPNTPRNTPIYGADYQEEFSNFPGHAQFYLSGNIDGRRQTTSSDERLFMDPADWKYVVSQVIGTLSVVNFTGAAQATKDITAYAGAFPRDASDQRVLGDFLACRGSIIDDPSQIGGWPSLATGTPYPDADSDGMDDRWEASHNVTSANADADGDGYTNFEEFLNELAGDQDTNGNLFLRTGAGQGTIPAVNCGITAV